MRHVEQVRHDLTSAQRGWQVKIAERDAANRDLAAANVELRAMNQEIAFQNRELRDLNDELMSLIKSTSIPIVMVDRKLKILRLTPAAEYPFNLKPADVGREITDIRPNFDHVDFSKLIRRVIDEACEAEVEVMDGDAHVHLLRVRPYRAAHRVEGATLTLINIDRMSSQRSGKSMVDSVFESIPGPLAVLDDRLRIRVASRDFLTIYGLSFANIVNRTLEEVVRDPFGARDFKRAFARLASGETDAEEIGFLQKTAPAGDRALIVLARRVQCGEVHQFVVAMHDVTLDTKNALRLSHQEMQALAGRLLHTQDEERRRLSRELHDDLSQNVSALQLDVEALSRKLPSKLREESKELASIRDSAQQLSEDLRRIAHGLHPSTIEILGLPAALNVYAAEFSKRTGIVVEFGAAAIPAKIPPDVASSFYRIMQEALRNIAKYAAHGHACILLSGRDSFLTLSVRDHGPGFDREAVRGRGGLGLVSMEERARLIRARFELNTAPGKGVTITVSAPLN